MRKPLIAGNWKMHTTISEAVSLAEGIKKELSDFSKVDIVLCPPFISLNAVYKVIMDTSIKLGAQNVAWEKEGAYTGEISNIMLRECGCKFAIVGHSERRKYFCESNKTVNKRIKSALEGGLTPIMCVGETLKEREDNLTMKVISRQLEGGLDGLAEEEVDKIIIAYEPIWAIGTGKTATPAQAQEIHKFIRSWLSDKTSSDCASSVRILYGGSVKPGNIKELIKEADIDGGLVGGASLKAESFIEIVKNSV